MGTARRLSALYVRHCPETAISGRDSETLALALLARAHYTLQTVLAVPTQELDCIALVRSIYEHVVAFAWLAIDPEAHRPMLLKWEFEERKKMLKDAAEWFEHVEPPDEGAVRRALVDMGHVAAPETPDRALAADKYWSRCGISWEFHFRSGYSSLFRLNSAFLHPTVAGVFPFITPGSPARVSAEPRRAHVAHPLPDAMLAFADGLAVASYRFGWPPVGDLRAAFMHGLVQEGSECDE
jgi:hypothetical protein